MWLVEYRMTLRTSGPYEKLVEGSFNILNGCHICLTTQGEKFRFGVGRIARANCAATYICPHYGVTVVLLGLPLKVVPTNVCLWKVRFQQRKDWGLPEGWRKNVHVKPGRQGSVVFQVQDIGY